MEPALNIYTIRRVRLAKTRSTADIFRDARPKTWRGIGRLINEPIRNMVMMEVVARLPLPSRMA